MARKKKTTVNEQVEMTETDTPVIEIDDENEPTLEGFLIGFPVAIISIYPFIKYNLPIDTMGIYTIICVHGGNAQIAKLSINQLHRYAPEVSKKRIREILQQLEDLNFITNETKYEQDNYKNKLCIWAVQE